MPELRDLLPATCQKYPEFVACCPGGCRLATQCAIEWWIMTGAVENAKAFAKVLRSGDSNPNDASRNRVALTQEGGGG